jgi:hypothetical protein
MSKIDRKLVDVDSFLEILFKAGGNIKALSLFAKQCDTYYWFRLRDRRVLTIGDVYILEQYLNKKFGKGTFEDSYLEVMDGNAIGNMKNQIENLEKSIKEIKDFIKSTKNPRIINDFQKIIGE